VRHTGATMIADSHAHLDMPQFDSDRDDVIRRARDCGVDLLVTIGTGNPAESSVEKTLELAETHDFIYAGLGVHPHDARLADESYWERMGEWARHPEVVLWGEIGLDYYYDHSPREIQRLVFRRQLRMAREHNLPVSIHCRDAWPDLLAILKEDSEFGKQRGILHSFTGDSAQARECAAMGFLISFSGIVTFKNAAALREAARGLRLDQILVETDAPFLAPVPHRGRRNEPAYVVDVAKGLAQTMEVSFDEIARHTMNNLRRLILIDD
jgi:TatD DNase family protein